MNCMKTSLVALLVSGFLSILFTQQAAISADDKSDKIKADLISRSNTDSDKKIGVDPKNLRRVDFRVEGSKCASCLGRIRKRMTKIKGVVDAAVLIKRPYGAVAIYDSSKVNVDKILKEALVSEKENVKILDVNDRAIDKLPFLLVPVFSQLKK